MQRGLRPHDVALIDFDGTLRPGWTLGLLVDTLATSHATAEEAAADFGMLIACYRNGKLSHDELVDLAESVYAKAIDGVGDEQLTVAYESVAEECLRTLYPFARPLLAGLRIREIDPVIVTGGPHPVIERVASALDVDRFWAFDIDTRLAQPTGEVCNPGRSSVKRKIGDIERRHAAVRLGLGDSTSDGPLWDAADVAVVVGSHVTDARITCVDGATSSADEILSLLD